MSLRVSTPKNFSYLEPHCYARKLPVYIQTHDIGECHPFNLASSRLSFFLKTDLYIEKFSLGSCCNYYVPGGKERKQMLILFNTFLEGKRAFINYPSWDLTKMIVKTLIAIATAIDESLKCFWFCSTLQLLSDFINFNVYHSNNPEVCTIISLFEDKEAEA